MVAELGEVVWIVDLNRQSLDRVVPGIGTPRLQGMFAAAGWQVLTVKYGQLLEELFARPGGESLRHRIDEMPNPEYQRLLRLHARTSCGTGCQATGPDAAPIRALLAGVARRRRCGGGPQPGRPRPAALDEAFAAIDDTRPTVIFAYTVKGYGLAIEGHPQNHSALLTEAQLARARRADSAQTRPSVAAVPRRLAPRRPLCAAAAERRAARPRSRSASRPPCPATWGAPRPGPATTQAALGRALLDAQPGRARGRAPDRHGEPGRQLEHQPRRLGQQGRRLVLAPSAPTGSPTTAETILHWRERPAGQHIELGIAETNLVGAARRARRDLEPLGPAAAARSACCTTRSSSGRLSPGRSASTRAASRSWSARPPGVSLAPEGGAHQSITTPSIGLEQPGCVSYEPAFAIDTEWVLLAVARADSARPGGQSAYLRLSTRPVDQALAAVPADPAARERRRRTSSPAPTCCGGTSSPAVTICAMGALVPEALAAAERLDAMGFGADVICVTSPDLLFQRHAGAPRARRRPRTGSWTRSSPPSRAAPMVTRARRSSAHAGVPRRHSTGCPPRTWASPRFGQSGDLDSTYRYHHIDADSVVGAALDLID